jgi:uncharacterized membrane protein
MLSPHPISSGGMPVLLPLQAGFIGYIGIILYVISFFMVVFTFLNIRYILKNTNKIVKHLENIEAELGDDTIQEKDSKR